MGGNIEPAPVTELLRRMGAGDVSAQEELLDSIYAELRVQARLQMARLRPGQTLQATALVHEAWLKIQREGDGNWDSRAHFFSAAARAMRNILVDQVRRKSRGKHGGEFKREPLGADIASPLDDQNVDILALDEALKALEKAYERPARIVMLRYFAGLSLAQVGESLGVSTRTVDREWAFARSWLWQRLHE